MATALGARQRARASAFGNGFKNVMGPGSRLVLKPERLKNAHGPVAIALGARQRARAFAFGNGFKNVMGSGSRLDLNQKG